jgi:thiosulfate/3-mercaptopyruvate sulfurtransferase
MDHSTTLIEPDALAAWQQQAPMRVTICDCSFDLTDHEAGQRAYEAGHIPGAVYLHLETALSGAKTGRNGRHPLPAREDLAPRLAALGAGADHQFVAYDAREGMFAARLWWLLRWLGHENVAVLNGGLAAWRRAGLPVEAGTPAPRPPGDIAARPSLVPVIEYAAVRAGLNDPTHLIIDARAPDRFRGENETLDARGGHIPGARNRFFKDNLDSDGRFKPADTLRAEFTTILNTTKPTQSIAQCGSGVTACHNLLAMDIAGLTGAALYPGSWSEWSTQADAPVAVGSE